MKFLIVLAILFFSAVYGEEEGLPGGVSPFDDQEVIMTYVNHGLNNLVTEPSEKLEFVRIVNATHQVVAGSDYKIFALFNVGDSKTESLCLFDIWDQYWLPQSCTFDISCTHRTFSQLALDSPIRKE